MRLVLRIDALIEAVLAVCCFALAAADPHRGASRLPTHVPTAVVIALGVVLVAVVAVLWWLSTRPRRAIVLLVCVANGITAFVAAWLAVVVDAGSAVRLLLAGCAVALAALAVSQALVALARAAPSP